MWRNTGLRVGFRAGLAVGAAVDGDGGAGDEAGLVAAEEGDDGAEVLGPADGAGGDAAAAGREVAAVEAAQPVGVVRAGQHRVHGDAVGGDLEGQRLEEAGDARPGPCSTGSGRRSAGAPRST